MEDRRKLVGDLERYDALLRLTTDHQAITAIEQLIRETRDRLNELDRADEPVRRGGLLNSPARPPAKSFETASAKSESRNGFRRSVGQDKSCRRFRREGARRPRFPYSSDPRTPSGRDSKFTKFGLFSACLFGQR
jgi:hypothetical protein